MNDDWYRAVASATLPDGRAEHVQINGADVLLVRVAGTVHAVSNICSHADACLHEGRVRGQRIICPLHGASFDVRTGAVLGKPATHPLPRYEVREDDGVIWVLVKAPAS